MRTKTYYQAEYVDKQRSIYDLSKEHKTYPNKIRREILLAGLPLRDKSEAQKAALASGRHKHPTKGSERPIETRMKISVSVSEARQNAKTKEDD